MTQTDRQQHQAHLQNLEHLAQQLRRDSIEATSAAGSGHPTSCLSCAEIMSALFFEQMRYDPEQPNHPHNDEFILSKGHAAPILWSVFHRAGMISREELLSLRKIDSQQEGHPTPRNPWVKVSTGSLGQGLSMGIGMAWAAKVDQSPSHVFVLMGDAEIAEGSVWEAAELASDLELGNLVAIVDVNGLGQSGPSLLEHELAAYVARFRAFGWDTQMVNGHDMEAVCQVLRTATSNSHSKPQVILARTVKGKGVEELEGLEGKHGKPAPDQAKALAELEPADSNDAAVARISRPSAVDQPRPDAGPPRFQLKPRDVEPGKPISPREAFGQALIQMGKQREDLMVLDGDVKNSTKLESFFEAWPDRAIECFIAEQNMVGFALGASKRGKLPVVATFATFLTRAFDQLRMAAISRGNLKLVGSHVGVSIGEDGPSQMGLEDLAMFRAIPDSQIFYPSDAVSTDAATALVGQSEGVAYLRLTRGELPVVYAPDYAFEPGKCPLWHAGQSDQLTLIGAGVTFHGCLEARERLQAAGISARVVDCFSVKPIDAELLRRCVQETGRLLVVEDHYAQGGIGEAVLSAVDGMSYAWKHLAVREMPRSGDPDALLSKFGLDADAICAAAETLVRQE